MIFQITQRNEYNHDSLITAEKQIYSDKNDRSTKYPDTRRRYTRKFCV